MGKQTGFIYYITAANTSKIDFATGFVNFLYPKIEDAEEFFQKFDCIQFNPDKNYFEFIARYNNFMKDDEAKLADDKNVKWVICTHGEKRFQYQPYSKTFNVYFLKTEKSKDYTRWLIQSILDHKEDIFTYVQEYYRCFMRGKTIDEYPIFRVNKVFIRKKIWNK